jgi:hypothetical protein
MHSAATLTGARRSHDAVHGGENRCRAKDEAHVGRSIASVMSGRPASEALSRGHTANVFGVRETMIRFGDPTSRLSTQ